MATATTRLEKLTDLKRQHDEAVKALEHAERAATPEVTAIDRAVRLESLGRELSEAQRRPSKHTRPPEQVQADIAGIDAYYTDRGPHVEVMRERVAALRQEVVSLEQQLS